MDSQITKWNEDLGFSPIWSLPPTSRIQHFIWEHYVFIARKMKKKNLQQFWVEQKQIDERGTWTQDLRIKVQALNQLSCLALVWLLSMFCQYLCLGVPVSSHFAEQIDLLLTSVLFYLPPTDCCHLTHTPIVWEKQKNIN